MNWLLWSWCAPCKLAHKALETELGKAPGDVVVANINCDESEELVLDYRVEVVPTLVLLNQELNVIQSKKSVLWLEVKGFKADKIKELILKSKEFNNHSWFEDLIEKIIIFWEENIFPSNSSFWALAIYDKNINNLITIMDMHFMWCIGHEIWW